MEENSIEQCKYIVEIHLARLQKAFDRMKSHDTLITNLMNPSHKLGKALRSIEWMDEAADEHSLNAYGGKSNVPWHTVRNALDRAHVRGDMPYVTLIPDKLELHNAVDELILEFASKGDYYHLIVELKLKLRIE